MTRPTTISVASAQAAERPERLQRRVLLEMNAAPAHQELARRDADDGDGGDEKAERRHIAEDAGAETRQAAIDENGQGEIVHRRAQKSRNAEIADAGDEGEQRRADEMRAQQRQKMIGDDPHRMRAVDAGCFHDGGGNALQARTHHHIDERRVMQPHHQHDAAASEHRIGAAGFRREAQRVEDRRGGTGEMQKGQRHHLRRDHHRQNEEERDETPPAHVGDAEREGHGDAERQREKARQESGFERRTRCIQRRAARQCSERRVGIEDATWSKRRQQQACRWQDIEGEDDQNDESEKAEPSPLQERPARCGMSHCPKMSAKAALFLVSSDSAFAASNPMTLICSRAG